MATKIKQGYRGGRKSTNVKISSNHSNKKVTVKIGRNSKIRIKRG